MSTDPFTNQAIFTRATTYSVRFVHKPSDATRDRLVKAGLIYDGKSQQWYVKNADNQLGL